MPLNTLENKNTNIIDSNTPSVTLKGYTKEDYLKDEYSRLLEDLRGIEDAITSIKANRCYASFSELLLMGKLYNFNNFCLRSLSFDLKKF